MLMRRIYGPKWAIGGNAHCLLSCLRTTSNGGNNGGPIQYYNPHTWPKHWTADDIKVLVQEHISKVEPAPNYDLFAKLLRLDVESLEIVLRTYCKAPVLNVGEYLEENLGSGLGADPAIVLHGRDEQVAVLDKATTVIPGTATRRVTYCNSIAGSGKSQFVESFLLTKRKDAMERGLVIVRRCDATPQSSWISLLMKDCLSQKKSSDNIDDSQSSAVFPLCTHLTTGSTAAGLCELIRTHVQTITGCLQSPDSYDHPSAAYATWRSETERHFGIQADAKNMEPLIVLDACEELAQHKHKSLVHPTSREPYTLLEALCLAVPSPYCIFVIGRSGKVCLNDPLVTISVANVTDIGPLLLPKPDDFVDKIDANLREPLYHLTGGLPRLLRLARVQEPRAISLAQGCTNVFSRCFESFKKAAKLEVDERLLPYAYTCLLASSTKARVRNSDPIAVNPEWRAQVSRTYDDAMMSSIGMLDKHRLIMPPITFVDDATSGMPILPSQLHPTVKADIVEHFSELSLADRERMFAEAFLYAVYARYLLAYWEDPSCLWVSLAKVFEGAVQPSKAQVLENYEVNLSSGVKSEPKSWRKAIKDALTHRGGVHHEAVIWCRKKTLAVKKNNKNANTKKRTDQYHLLNKNAPFAVRLLFQHDRTVHQNKKSRSQSKTLQLSIEKKGRTSLNTNKNNVSINADAMSSVAWLLNADFRT